MWRSWGQETFTKRLPTHAFSWTLKNWDMWLWVHVRCMISGTSWSPCKFNRWTIPQVGVWVDTSSHVFTILHRRFNKVQWEAESTIFTALLPLGYVFLFALHRYNMHSDIMCIYYEQHFHENLEDVMLGRNGGQLLPQVRMLPDLMSNLVFSVSQFVITIMVATCNAYSKITEWNDIIYFALTLMINLSVNVLQQALKR